MIKNKSIFTILFILLSLSSHSQIKKVFIILTFEKTDTFLDGTEERYWIVPGDSIISMQFKLSYLIFNRFPASAFIECSNGRAFNPFDYKQGDVQYTDTIQAKRIDGLFEIVNKNRKQLQVINKKWLDKNKQVIKVFATPILGEFCSGPLDSFGKKTYNYNGEIFLPAPTSEYIFYREFWADKKSKFLQSYDFAYINSHIFLY